MSKTFNILTLPIPSALTATPIPILKKQLTAFILNPKYHDFLSVIKAGRNGLVYGSKVRFPHALIMAILFGSGAWSLRASGVLRATKLHGFNLMKFAMIFKSIQLALRRARGGQETPLGYGIAGLVGGYLIFGERNAVNEQLAQYIIARIVWALLPRAQVPDNYPTGKAIPVDRTAFKWASAVCWSLSMYIWYLPGKRGEIGGQRMGQGILSSANYIYKDAETWNSLRNFLWHNK